MVPKAYSDNLKVVSIESLARDQDEAVIWRGPLKMHVIRQFISDVHWERLDYLMELTGKSATILEELPGRKLEGLQYEHPFQNKINKEYDRKVAQRGQPSGNGTLSI